MTKHIYEPWARHLTDKGIKNCQGDYYGCEICRNKNRCLKLAETEILEKIKEKECK